ncbi:MAG TPA: transposase [Candidatus Saccharimonadales bacterium]
MNRLLATSVLDTAVLSRDDLGELYWMRWGVETFYGILKTRLGLENFSGYSPDAVQQDFFSAVLLSGIESIMVEDAEGQLAKQTAGHPKKVNKAVSFNAIKERAFELFMSDDPDDEVLGALTNLFMASPTLVRKDRNPPRSRSSPHQLLGWWRRKRKATF